MNSTSFKVFTFIIVSIAIFYVVSNVKQGIENRNNTYIQYLNKG